MKDFTNTGGTGTIQAGIPVVLGAATTEFRFYGGFASIEQDVRVTFATGVGSDNGWKPNGRLSGGPQPYQETLINPRMSRTKVNQGNISFSSVGASFDDVALSDPYTAFWHRFVSEPCAAQTVSGTCTVVIAQRGPTQGECALTAAVRVISADGLSVTTIGSQQGSGSKLLSSNEVFRTVTVTMSPGAVELGGRVCVEVGATFAKDPVVANEAVRMYKGTQLTFDGSPVADGVVADLDGDLKAGHFTFSGGITIKPTQWAGGNDECANATGISGLPVAVGPLDTTKSPGIDPGTFGQDPNTRNLAWYRWTSPITGTITISTLGSNYRVEIRVRDNCGDVFPNLTQSRARITGQSQSAANFDVVAGVEITISFSSFGRPPGSSQTGDFALQSGGNLFFRIFEVVDEAQTDDLYLAGKHIFIYRKIAGTWTHIGYNNGLTFGFIPTGMSFDYARSGVPSLNAGEATPPHDLLISSLFFFSNLLEAYHADTLSRPTPFGSEYNFLCLSGSSNAGPGADLPGNSTGSDQKIIPQSDGMGGRVQGRAIVGTEGDNYDFYGALSSVAAAGFWEVEMVPEWWCGTAPNFKSRVLVKHSVDLEVQSTDHFDIMPDLDTILYTSAGQRILRYRMSDTTQLSDFVSNVPTSDSARPGARGIRISPSLEVFVSIGSKVHHYSASGSLIKTMQSNNPSRHGSLERMAFRADGRTLLVVDVSHGDVLEFDTVSGAHVDTIDTGLPVGSLCGIACYRGFEQPPPPPPPTPPGEPPPTGEPPASGLGTLLPIRRQRAAPHINDEQTWVFYSRLQVDLETGVGLVSGQGVDPQIMMDFSDDGGHTWCNEQWRSAGKIGEFKLRALWRRLGRSRDRIYRITVTDPVKWAIVDAYLEGSGGTS